MKDFLIEVKTTPELSTIKDNAKVLITGSLGNKWGSVFLSVDPKHFDKPNSTFVHIRFAKDPPTDWFMEGATKLITEDLKNEFPILGIIQLG